jgi:GTPase
MTDFDDDTGRPAGGKSMVDQRAQPTRAAAIVPDVRGRENARTAEARLEEFNGLAEAIDLELAFSEVVKVREIRPATFIGSGHVEDIAKRAKELKIELLLVDAPISPIQQRNLEKETGTKVLDRTALILEIFGERAATKEGTLQVELAHLKYQRSRLVRSWTHLERQRGGFGFLGGPGETQIESDRRVLEDRIKLLEERIDKVKKTRTQQKSSRAGQFPAVALVGYTNAGKSSIFNALTGAGVFAKDLLFATLDTTVRKIELPHGREVMLSDTVGFVSDLPTELVAAFRATLEEVIDADVILHVRDVANPDHAAQAEDVLKVLNDLGVSPDKVAVIEILNKVDLLPDRGPLATVVPASKVAASVPVSAVTGEGLDALQAAIEAAVGARSRAYKVHVPHTAGADVGWLYEHAEIVGHDEPDEQGTTYEVRVEPRHLAAFNDRFAGRMHAA